jgi:hypothetical protein
VADVGLTVTFGVTSAPSLTVMEFLPGAGTGLSLVSFVHDVNTLAPQIQKVAASTQFMIFFIVVFYLIDILW